MIVFSELTALWPVTGTHSLLLGWLAGLRWVGRITDQERVDFNLTADCVATVSQHEIEDVAKVMVLHHNAPSRVMCQNELGAVTNQELCVRMSWALLLPS